MESSPVVSFDRREATVLADVLSWAADTDDIEDRTHGSNTGYREFDPQITNELIDRVATEHELPTAYVSPSELQILMEAFASEFQDQAWEMDDPKPTFEFYESVFEAIETAVDSQV